MARYQITDGRVLVHGPGVGDPSITNIVGPTRRSVFNSLEAVHAGEEDLLVRHFPSASET